jgi:type VI secretion system secreted protein Hcp
MAAADYFLKLDGIEGESQDSKHKNEIQISSYTFGATQQGSFSQGTGGGSGKVQMQDFQFTVPTNKSSPKLFAACATGQHIKTAILTVRKAGKEQQEYLKYTFSNVLVSSYNTLGNGDNILPADQITLNFAKLDIEYKQQSEDGTLSGTVKSGYDVQQNKGY